LFTNNVIFIQSSTHDCVIAVVDNVLLSLLHRIQFPLDGCTVSSVVAINIYFDKHMLCKRPHTHSHLFIQPLV